MRELNIRFFQSPDLKGMYPFHHRRIRLRGDLNEWVFCFYDNSKSKTTTNNDEILEYVSTLEDKLCNLLSKVDGCGKVQVAIMIDSGKETVLAMKTIKTEISGKIEIEETPIIVNGKTVVVKENYPKITGVLIVCEGANNIFVMNKIQQATTSLLDVDINKIEILAMK